VKVYAAGDGEEGDGPAVCIACEKKHEVGRHPDPEHAGTSYIERANLTVERAA
jgi:hypothetical protein